METSLKIFKAIRENRVDVPILHYEELDGGGIRLHLYGGRRVEWKPEEDIDQATGDKKVAEGKAGLKKTATRRTKK